MQTVADLCRNLRSAVVSPHPLSPSPQMWRGGTKGHHFFPFFSFGATRRCHPERARGCARAKDLLVVASRMRGNARAKDLLLRNLSDGSPRAARARAKDLLVVASRMRGNAR